MRSLAERVILKKLSACIFLFFSVVTTAAQSKEWLLDNGDRVLGERVDGLLQGQVEYFWSAGDRFLGEFKDDLPHGHGSYFWMDGRVYVGNFEY